MYSPEHQAEQFIQSNRQLDEWSTNSTLEVETRYVLGGRHREEYSLLPLAHLDAGERALLIDQHLKEIIALKQNNSEVRIAIEVRHRQERTDLNKQFLGFI